MSINFETKVSHNWCNSLKPHLVIYSEHCIDGRGRLTNMFTGGGTPTVDVADAEKLRDLLDDFIYKYRRHKCKKCRGCCCH